MVFPAVFRDTVRRTAAKPPSRGDNLLLWLPFAVMAIGDAVVLWMGWAAEINAFVLIFAALSAVLFIAGKIIFAIQKRL